MRLLGLCLIAGWLALANAAQPATPENVRVSEAPTLQSDAVIAAAQRIKGALVRLQPCPSAAVARYSIGVAAEGVKLEILLLALELTRTEEGFCRGARRGLAQAIEDARLALAALGPTGATGSVVPSPSGPTPIRGETFGRGVGFGAPLGGIPGGAGGAGYRPQG